MFVPNWILRIGYYPGSGNPGSGEANRDIRIAGDDLAVVLTITAVIGGKWLATEIECGEATAETLRDQVHVRQASGLDDFQLKISMEVYYVVF